MEMEDDVIAQNGGRIRIQLEGASAHKAADIKRLDVIVTQPYSDKNIIQRNESKVGE